MDAKDLKERLEEQILITEAMRRLLPDRSADELLELSRIASESLIVSELLVRAIDLSKQLEPATKRRVI